MANELPPAPFAQKHRSRPSGHTILASFLTLLILFLWLHLILALQIEGTGRKIQTQTAALERIRREIAAVEHKIAIAQSEESLASRARALGYQQQAPIYLLVPASLGQSSNDVAGEDARATSASAGRERSAFQTLSLWAGLAQTLSGRMDAGTRP